VKSYAKATYERSSPKTYRWYLFGIAVLATTELARLRLDEIGTEQVAELTAELQRRKKTAKGKDGNLQLSTINSCLRALRRVLHLAVEWEVIDAAPKVRMLSGERHRELVITPKEEAKYLAAGNALLNDVSLVLFDTGMRPEECHRMRWEFVNWDGGRFGVVLIPDGKSEAARRLLPLSARVRVSLEKRWKDAGEPAEGSVWPADNKDGHINHDSLKAQHKKAVRLAKVRPFDVYSIRHTFLTRLGESGCDVWTLARIAGHSNIKMSQRSVHPSADAVLNAVSQLGRHKTGHSGEMTLGTGDAAMSETHSDSES
jgi:integrase